MINTLQIEKMTLSELENKYPFVLAFFEQNQLDTNEYRENTFEEYLNHFTDEQKEELALDPHKLKEDLKIYIEQMISFLGLDKNVVESLTILPGTDKYGNAEKFNELTIHKSQIISIVGPTGSGKSRLLADIEWVANQDTPTQRVILINGETPNKSIRFEIGNKLVAQLSQNMNFVMDLTVQEFLSLHAKSRMIANEEEVIQKIILAANELAGEKFDLSTPITSLSGGQSRALMIADTAILSTSPIVLIDEIENAGIDRKRALNLLVNEEKIVLMATHDPTLALMADQRIVIKNGGIHEVIQTDENEKGLLTQLAQMDEKISLMRTKLRMGEILQKEDLL